MQTERSDEPIAGSSAEPGRRATPMPGHTQTQMQRDRQRALETGGREKTQEHTRTLQRPLSPP